MGIRGMWKINMTSSVLMLLFFALPGFLSSQLLLKDVSTCPKLIGGVKDQKADLLPSPAHFLAGKPFQMSCLVKEECVMDAGNRTISFHVYKNKTKLPSDWVTQVTSPRAGAVLSHPGLDKITEDARRIFFRCMIGNEVLAKREVWINDPPLPVENLSCVSPNLTSMACVFCEPVPDPQQWVTYIIHWRLRDTVDWYSAELEPMRNRMYCYEHTWPFETRDPGHRFVALKDYVLEVEAASKWTEASNQTVVSQFNISYQQIVKPSPVRDIKVSAESGWLALLTWSEPPGLAWANPQLGGFLYQITYSSSRQKSTVNTTSLMLEGLRPDTEYAVSMRARPGSGGYWSEVTNTTFTTPAEPPDRPPVSAPGMHRKESCGDGCQQVHIYWGEVPRDHQNGDITGYSLTVFTGADAVSHNLTLPPDQFMYNLTVRGAASLSVRLQALNRAGSSPAANWRIDSKTYPSPVNVIGDRIDDSVVRFRWQKPNTTHLGDHVFLQGYTIMSCRSADDECQGPANYVTVDANTSSYNLTIGEGHLLHSISADYVTLDDNDVIGLTSEVTHWICVFQIPSPEKGNKPLKLNVEEEPETLLLTWEYTCAETGLRIDRYLLTVATPEPPGAQGFEFDGDATTFSVPGIQPSTEYTILLKGMANDVMAVSAKETFVTASPNQLMLFLLMFCVLLIIAVLCFVIYRVTLNMKTTLEIHLPEHIPGLLSDTHSIMDLREGIGKHYSDEEAVRNSHTSSSGYGGSTDTSSSTELCTPPTPPPTGAATPEAEPLLNNKHTTNPTPSVEALADARLRNTGFPGIAQYSQTGAPEYVAPSSYLCPQPYVSPDDVKSMSTGKTPVENTCNMDTPPGSGAGGGSADWSVNGSGYCGHAQFLDRKSNSSNENEDYCIVGDNEEEKKPQSEQPPTTPENNYCGHRQLAGSSKESSSGEDRPYCDAGSCRCTPLQFDECTGPPVPLKTRLSESDT